MRHFGTLKKGLSKNERDTRDTKSGHFEYGTCKNHDFKTFFYIQKQNKCFCFLFCCFFLFCFLFVCFFICLFFVFVLLFFVFVFHICKNQKETLFTKTKNKTTKCFIVFTCGASIFKMSRLLILKTRNFLKKTRVHVSLFCFLL